MQSPVSTDFYALHLGKSNREHLRKNCNKEYCAQLVAIRGAVCLITEGAICQGSSMTNGIGEKKYCFFLRN